MRSDRKTSLVIIVVGITMLVFAAIDLGYSAGRVGGVVAAIAWAILGAITLALGARRLTSSLVRVTPTSVEVRRALIAYRNYPIRGLADLDFDGPVMYRLSDGAELVTFDRRRINRQDLVRLTNAILHAHFGLLGTPQAGRRN